VLEAIKPKGLLQFYSVMEIIKLFWYSWKTNDNSIKAHVILDTFEIN